MAQASSLQCIVEPAIPPEHCIKEMDAYVREPVKDHECEDPNSWGMGMEPMPNRQRLVYVDTYGNPGSSSGRLPVTASCYISFMPMP